MHCAQVLDDLVSGELQQLGGLELFPSESSRARDRALLSTERLLALSSPALAQRDAPVSPLERALAHCLGKTYRKTASLIANFARAVRYALPSASASQYVVHVRHIAHNTPNAASSLVRQPVYKLVCTSVSGPVQCAMITHDSRLENY